MADGISADGLTLHDPRFREMFPRESVLASDWYADRLDAAQPQLVARAEAGVAAIEALCAEDSDGTVTARMGLAARLAEATAARDELASGATRERLVGTLGRQVDFR